MQQQHTMIPYLYLFLVALVTALLTTPIARKIAWAVDAVDYPSKRRINKKPIPRMGGIAIFLGIAAAFLTLYLGTEVFGWEAVMVPAPNLRVNYWMIGVAFCIVFATGMLDDKFQLTPRQKLAGQFLAAVVAVAGGLVIGTIVDPVREGEMIGLGWIAYPITVIYLLGYMNVINLIDGLDGLAAGISTIASATMFVLAILAGRYDAAALAIAVSGSSLGFLKHNFHPASVFMGDSGALTLGFALGTTSLLSVTRVAGLTTIIVPLVIAGIPIIDTFSAIVRRTRAGVSIGHADRGHIHHRLLQEGFDQRQTVLLIYAWTALLCGGSLVMTQVQTLPRIAIFVLLLAMSLMFSLHLRLFDPVLLHYYDPKTGDDTLVTPQDEEFEVAAEKFDEEHHHPLAR